MADKSNESKWVIGSFCIVVIIFQVATGEAHMAVATVVAGTKEVATTMDMEEVRTCTSAFCCAKFVLW